MSGRPRVGDTVTSAAHPATEALAGYAHPRPMVFSGLYPVDGDQYPDLRDALDKLRLNDASLVYEPETSTALGFGFRCGFLGLLHMEIIRERLEREFDLSLISTAPNVVYRVVMDSGAEVVVTNPSEFPSGPGGVRDQDGRHRGRQDRPGLRAGRAGHGAGAVGLHRRDHGAVPVPARRPARDGVPVGRPGRDQVHDAARRDHLRLLRSAEVPHQGLCVAGLRARRRAGGRPGQGRHPAAGRSRSTRSARSSTPTRRASTAWR